MCGPTSVMACLTASALMPTMASGTATFPISDACVFAKTVKVLQTVSLDRGCFACMLGGVERSTSFLVATEWRGTEHMADGTQTGQILNP